MSGHTPWRYLIHKSDSFSTKIKKRVGRLFYNLFA